MSVRRHRRLLVAALLLGAGVWFGAAAQDDEPHSRVVVLTVQDAIGPATSDYVGKGIAHAIEAGATLVVLELDTPGGLDTSMREIIQSILGSPVPVATFVFPQGARAASAGTYILYASHVAAMAPATNLGAATPVAIGGGSPLPGAAPDQGARQEDGASPDTAGQTATDAPDGNGNGARDGGEDPAADPASLDDGRGTQSETDTATDDTTPPTDAPTATSPSERKAINDAVAYIRSLAERRGRNADWAERAVRSSESLSAMAALEMGVIDIVADDLDDLLRRLGDREVNGTVLSLPADATLIERFEPDWRTRLLAAISNPTIAYILLLIGIYGLVFEGYNPGAIVPGVVGAISLLLAFFAFQILPVNYAGLALIVLGVILMLAEFLVPSFGALGIGGVAAFVFGSLILIDTDVPGFTVAVPLVSTVAVTVALAVLGTIWLAMKSRIRPLVSGVEEMLGMEGHALEDFEHEGDVWVHGERWRAVSSQPVRKSQRLKVTAIDGLTLSVEPTEAVQQ